MEVPRPPAIGHRLWLEGMIVADDVPDNAADAGVSHLPGERAHRAIAVSIEIPPRESGVAAAAENQVAGQRAARNRALPEDVGREAVFRAELSNASAVVYSLNVEAGLRLRPAFRANSVSPVVRRRPSLPVPFRTFEVRIGKAPGQWGVRGARGIGFHRRHRVRPQVIADLSAA
jgi:hypothetical protein